MKTFYRYVALIATIFIYLYIFFVDFSENERADDGEDSAPNLFDSMILENLAINLGESQKQSLTCSMNNCFNFSKCYESKLVYVYPDIDGLPPSSTYAKILKGIRESKMYSSDPSKACLFVLSLDTVDRDRRSENYVTDMQSYIDKIPRELWNNGINHIIFNLYHGTFPDYSDHNLGFNTEKAMIARASASEQHFRRGFDLSFPLFHKEHPLRNNIEREYALRDRDQYLVSFKGKRYVYGIGSETRDSLHHLHDGETIAMVTTCKHNNDWQMHQDERCDRDNAEYDRWDYESLMANSTFCLTPRGRRLGSFRFLESLGAGCIPVILSDDWVLPFSEFIDWKSAVVRINEKNVLLTPDVLYSFSREWVLRMRSTCRMIYNHYFASVEKIALTSLQIVLNRVHRSYGGEVSNLDTVLPPLDGKATVIIKATEKSTSRLQETVQKLAKVKNITEILIFWPVARGSAPVGADFGTHIRPKFVVTEKSEWVLSNLIAETSATIFLDERLAIEETDVLRVLQMLSKYPERIATSHAVDYRRGSVGSSVEFSRMFDVSYPALAAIHSAHLFSPYITRSLATGCDWSLLQLTIAQRSLAPPVLVGSRSREAWMRTDQLKNCLDKFSDRWPTGLPLIPSDLRFTFD